VAPPKDQTPPAETISWLLHSNPWTRYRTLRDLCEPPADDPEVIAAHQVLHEHPLVKDMIGNACRWPEPALKRHNDAAHPLCALTVCADMGIDGTALSEPLGRIAAHPSPEGPYRSQLQLYKRFTGRQGVEWLWMACDAPSLLYVALHYGIAPEATQLALEHLVGLATENGYRCVAAPELGSFHGPGRREDPCPIANLLALKALSLCQSPKTAAAAAAACEMLLWHWEHQKEQKLYLFGIGTDFRKPKYPLLWYDILHVVEVLSRFPAVHADQRFLQMLDTLLAQTDEQGRLTARSMYRAWKGWDFADKRTPSPWLTFLLARILKRLRTAASA